MVDTIDAVAGATGEFSGADAFHAEGVAGAGSPWSGGAEAGAFQAQLDRAADRPPGIVLAGGAPADVPDDTQPTNPYARGAQEAEDAWQQRLGDATNAAVRRFESDPSGAAEELRRINAAIVQSPGFAANYPAYAQNVSPHFFNNPTSYNVREVPRDPYLAGLSTPEYIAQFNATNVNPAVAVAADGRVYDISRDYHAVRQTAPWTAAIYQHNEQLVAQHELRSAVQERGLAGIPPEAWAEAALGGALIARGRGLRPVVRTPLASQEAVIPSDPFPTATRPTSGRGRLLGEAETVPENASALNKFGIRMQNESLARMADARYDVVRDPTRTLGRDGAPLLTQEQLRNLGLNPQARPDALINRRVFDVYSPTSATAAGVHQGIADKVGAGQAHRVVVNLSGTDVTPGQLRQYLESNPITNLREIILIDRTGNITNFYPF